MNQKLRIARHWEDQDRSFVKAEMEKNYHYLFTTIWHNLRKHNPILSWGFISIPLPSLTYEMATVPLFWKD
jgi:hypothetical protein